MMPRNAQRRGPFLKRAYRHFAERRELLFAVCEDAQAWMARAIEAGLESLTPLQFLSGALDAMADAGLLSRS